MPRAPPPPPAPRARTQSQIRRIRPSSADTAKLLPASAAKARSTVIGVARANAEGPPVLAVALTPCPGLQQRWT